MSFLHSLSAAALREAAGLKEEIHTLENRLKEIFGLGTAQPVLSNPFVESQPKVDGRKKKMSAAAKKKIGTAQKARWAKFHAAKNGAKVAKVIKASKASIITSKSVAQIKKKSTMSAAGKAAISVAAKARSAKVNAAKNDGPKTDVVK